MNKKDGTTLDIYLDMENQILPVPEFFWKIVGNSKITVVGLNNIFVDEVKALEKANTFCKVIDCKETGWFKYPNNGNNPSQGFIFCCEVNTDFLNKIELNLDFQPQAGMYFMFEHKI